MVENLKPIRSLQEGQAFLDAANERRWVSGDVKSNTLTDSSWNTLLEATGTNTKGFMPGYDDKNNRNFQGGSDLVVKDSGSNELSSDTLLRYAVYRSSDKEELVATSNTFRYGRFSNAKSNSKMEDKVPTELLNKVAGQDAVLVLEAKLTSGTSDFTPDSANSAHDVGVAYSKVAL